MAEIKDLRNYNNFRTGGNNPGAVIPPEKQATVAPGNGQSRNYILSDLKYAVGYPDNDTSIKVPKMVIMEYQPQYPIYTASLGKIGEDITAGVQKLISKYTGSLGASVASAATQGVAKAYANSYVDQVSQNPSALYQSGGDQSTVDEFFKLFRVDALGTYEVPFFADYAWEADGIKGWKTGDSSKDVGGNLNTMMAENMNVNWPTTPDWEYAPQYPEVTTKFHLINDSSEALGRNLQFLIAFTSGMRYVQIGKLFKSPNVYDIYVPGRFRWYWAAISAEVKFMGKIFYDQEISNALSNLKAFGGDTSGFPEAYEINLSVKSLLPNNFNLYIYYLVNGGSGRTTTNERVTEEALRKLTESLQGAGSAVIKAGDAIGGQTILNQLAKPYGWVTGQ